MKRLLAVLVTLAGAAAAAERPPVVVQALADRTALWPGDRLAWEVEVTCAPGVDVLAADLAPERLALTGLELVGSSRDRREEPGGVTRYRVRHVLTAYTFGTPLAIAPQTLRYHERRAGAGEGEGAPAGEVEVPGATFALRSTLPDDLAAARLRDEGAAERLPAFIAWLRPAGLALLLPGAVPVALGLAALGRRGAGAWRARRPRRPGDAARRELEALRALDARTESARRGGYDRLDALLRQRLGELSGVDARALTPAEIAALVARRGLVVPEALPLVLEECERARYARADALPPAERFTAAVDAARELVA